MPYDTDIWPVIKAKWFGPKRSKTDIIVVHTMEFGETDTAAETIANDFATRDPSNKASAQVCVDDNSIIQCVSDSLEAYAAGPTANALGVHIEHAGYMNQTVEQWRTPRSIAILAIGADVAAQYCIKYDIPPIHLTDEQLSKGMRGLVGHVQCSNVWHESTHQDPGPNFPWDRYLTYVKASIVNRSTAT